MGVWRSAGSWLFVALLLPTAALVQAQPCPTQSIIDTDVWPIELQLDDGEWTETRILAAPGGRVTIAGLRTASADSWEAPYDLLIRSSFDHGRTWEPPRGAHRLPIDGLGRLWGVEFELTTSGRLVVAANLDHDLVVFASDDGGYTFSEPAVVLDQEDASLSLAGIASAPDGMVAVIASKRVGSESFHLLATSPDGVVWDRPLHVWDDDGRLFAWSPNLLITDESVLVAEWDVPANDAFVARFPDRGLTFGSGRLVNGHPAGPFHGVTSSGERIQALYQERVLVGDEPTLTYLTTSLTDGASWLPPVDLDWTHYVEYPLMGSPGKVYIPASVHPSHEDAGIYFFHSNSHGAAGSWNTEPVEVPSLAIQSGTLSVFLSRKDDLLGIVRRGHVEVDGPYSWFLTATCDDGANFWAEDLDLGATTDGYGVYLHPSRVAVDPECGRLHFLLAKDLGFDRAVLAHVALDPATSPPDMTPSISSEEDCTAATSAVILEDPSVAWCLAPTFIWALDGRADGETSVPTYELPQHLFPGEHVVSCRVACEEPLTCGGEGASIVVDVPEPSSELWDQPIEGRLEVSKLGSDIGVTWGGLPPAANGASLYRGTLRSLAQLRRYDHAPLACHSVENESSFAPLDSESTYFLVVPHDCLTEGSAGLDSLGRQRPRSGQRDACGGA